MWQLNASSGCWLQFFPTPSIGDFNQDGITDIAVVSVVGSGVCPTASAGVVTVLSTGAAFNPGLNDWPLVRHDPRNTSVLVCSDFCLSASSSQTVAAGSTATYSLTITPNEIPYATAIDFTCIGLPTGASCNFSPSSVTPGLVTVSTTLSISTTSRTLAMARPRTRPLSYLPAAGFGVGGLALIPILVIPKIRSRRKSSKALFALLLISSFVGIGCGGSSAPRPNPHGTPVGSYIVTVSANGASKLSRTAKLSLIVE
jgi:hypothetical protein